VAKRHSTHGFPGFAGNLTVPAQAMAEWMRTPYFWLRDFDSDLAARTQVHASKDRSRVAACDEFRNSVVVDLASGLD